jgi:hypothetical protein
MIYRADPNYTRLLLALPESGMGYQIIEAFKPGRNVPDQFVVYNSELIFDRDSSLHELKRQIVSEGLTRMFEKAEILQLSVPKLVERRSLREFRGLSESKKIEKSRYLGGKGADENPLENGTGVEIFIRLSSFDKDNRLDFINRRFIPGTFSTTVLDYSECKGHSDDPLDRYALPLNEKIKWTFYVKPHTNDQLQRGIVRPAFGHDGGGEEIYFESGTSQGSFIKKLTF